MSLQKKRQSETYRDDCENENHDWENWGCFLGVCRVVIFGGFMPLKLKVWVNSFTCFRRMCLQETATVITLVKRHLSYVHFAARRSVHWSNHRLTGSPHNAGCCGHQRKANVGASINGNTPTVGWLTTNNPFEMSAFWVPLF